MGHKRNLMKIVKYFELKIKYNNQNLWVQQNSAQRKMLNIEYLYCGKEENLNSSSKFPPQKARKIRANKIQSRKKKNRDEINEFESRKWK